MSKARHVTSPTANTSHQSLHLRAARRECVQKNRDRRMLRGRSARSAFLLLEGGYGALDRVPRTFTGRTRITPSGRRTWWRYSELLALPGRLQGGHAAHRDYSLFIGEGGWE